MKKIIALILVCIFTLSFTACNDGKTETKNDGKVTITIGAWPNKDKNPTGYERKEAQRLAFMEKYPNINVETDSWGYSVDTFLPKAAANQLPTYFYLPFTEVDKVVDAGYVADITDSMKEYGFTENLKKEMIDFVSRNGKIYMIPDSYYAMGIGANRAVFKEAGLLNDDGTVKYPETFEELAETASAIKKKTGKAGLIFPTMNNAGGWHFMNIAWNYGTEFMKKKDGKWVACFDSDECAKALQYVKDLKWKYDALSDNLFIDNAEGIKMLGSGQGAMYMTTVDDNLLRATVVRNGMNKDDLSMGSMPKGPKGHISLMGGAVYAIPSSATKEQIDAVFKWIEFTGKGYTLTDDSKKSIEDSFKNNIAEGLPIIGKIPFTVWKDGEVVNYTSEKRKEYGNLDLKYFNDYFKFDGIELKTEEPVCAQELYSILDECIQEVLSNKDADVKAILKDANKKFQLNYLDNEE